MKKAKRILAGALAALILTMSLPLSALADEADVPVESPSFEVAFDVDTGQEEISEDSPADIEATPEPTPEPTAEPTQEPTPTPESTATPAPTAEPTAVPTATPGVTATPTAVPTSTPEPSAVPSASPVVTPTPTPTPSPQPVVNPVKLEHDVLDNVDKDCIYLFPVPNSSEITQEYSAEHKAIDIAALSGSPVYAAEDGTVSYVQIWDGSYDTTGMMSYGHMVEVRHADGNTTLYAHLSEINVQQGEKVVRGQRIGRVGSTGNATGPHLHFEVITSEGKADPAEYLWTMPGEWIMGYAADTEAGISLTGIGDTGKSVIHFYLLAKETTTTVTGSLGHLPTKAIKSGSTEYPAYCLEKDTQQDYVTLLTCTPYGVNTHRLLVRGHRVDMAEEAISEVEEKAVPEGSTWIEKYAEGLAIGLITSFAAMLLLLLILLIRRRQKKKTGNIAGSEQRSVQ